MRLPGSVLVLIPAAFILSQFNNKRNSFYSIANVKHFFTLLGKMFFTPYGKEFFTYLGKQIFTS